MRDCGLRPVVFVVDRNVHAPFRGVGVASTATLGWDPDFIEAAGFAWLAHETLAGRPGNRPSVTGARGPRILGAIWPG